jgi:DNA-binding GntR family transcriptional regulator
MEAMLKILVKKNRGLGDETVAQLEQLIITGQLKPGQKLLEFALAKQLGISRGPLREAIRTLEARRLVERKPFAGVRVVDLSVDEVEQLLIMREALEGMACRQAAENMTLHEVRQLRALQEGLNELVETQGVNGAFRAGMDYDLHLQIARGSRNRFLTDIICRDLYPLLGIFRYRTAQMRQGRFAAAAKEHSAIITAIERRQPDEAERLMRQHIARARETLMQHLRQTSAGDKFRRREQGKSRR